MNKPKRFAPLKSHKGIRKDTTSGRYTARKCINGKIYTKTFETVAGAVSWRKNFHPLLTSSEVSSPSVKKRKRRVSRKIPTRLNGVDARFTLREVWEFYKKYHFPTIEFQSANFIRKIASSFFDVLMDFKMQEINPEVLDSLMDRKVKEAKKKGSLRRYSFNHDLKCLKALLNWYRENYDGMFVVPILKRHFARGVLRKAPKRNVEKMNLRDVQLFLSCFDDPFWRDFAEMHFFMAARAQEVGGLQWESVHLEEGFLRVSDVSVWERQKKFCALKEMPKNGAERIVCLNQSMVEIFKRRWKNRSKVACKFVRESTGKRLNFVFEIKGQPVSYRSIQHRYNTALKKAGLYPRFRSTHILRKAMANIVRQELGLDAAQAAGGWKTRDIVEKVYSDIPSALSKAAVDRVEQMIVESESPPPIPFKLVQNPC